MPLICFSGLQTLDATACNGHFGALGQNQSAAGAQTTGCAGYKSRLPLRSKEGSVTSLMKPLWISGVANLRRILEEVGLWSSLPCGTLALLHNQTEDSPRALCRSTLFPTPSAPALSVKRLEQAIAAREGEPVTVFSGILSS